MSLVYGSYTQRELDEQYDTSVPVGGDVRPYLERFEAESGRARAALAIETIRYGPHEREILDYVAGEPGAPLFVWIHGGYWWRLSKDANTFVATLPAARGAAVALVNYPLAPQASLDEIVAAVRAAHARAVARTSEAGPPPRRIVAGGHSVGAQLAACVAATAPVDGLFALSGLYDLEPLRRSKINEKIAMDEASAARNAPVHLPPVRPGNLAIAAGGREQDEFHRQQRTYAAAWRAWGGDVRELDAADDDHFSIVLRLLDPASAPSQALDELLFS